MRNLCTFFSALLLVLICSQSSIAMRGDSFEFEIGEGTVRSTGAFCSGSCETRESKLTGTFAAEVAKAIFFTDVNVSTAPDLGFDLPFDPEINNGGVTRTVKFNFNGQLLKVSGVIDSRAFDGPLVEYEFSAVVVDQTGDFNQRGFFQVRPDFRKCVSPLCGGYFVTAVNRKLTRCADGSRQKECYVAEIELSGTSLSSTADVVQGRIVKKEFDFFGELGVFKAKAAYKAAGMAKLFASMEIPLGRFFGLEDTGLRCITYPCFSFDQYVLNHKRIRSISSINLENAGATQEQIDMALDQIAKGEVLIATGNNKQTEGPAGNGIAFVASRFYLPMSPTRCPDGYDLIEGRCVTPYGCETPLLEQTTYGGAAMVDPVTGKQIASISKSCVRSCESPAMEADPAQCTLALP